LKNIENINFYLIADLTKETEKFFLQKLENLLDTGIKLFQLRAKDYSDESINFYIEKIKKINDKYNATFIINDYWYFVREFELDGVHLGKNDFPPEVARYILSDKIIGWTINSINDIDIEVLKKIDYIGVGPAFHTKTKKSLSPVLGPEGIKKIIKQSNIPYFAIGGITDENISKLMNSGINHFALSSYLMKAEDPKKALNILKNQIDNFFK
jgi:thiamine-phosphate pyrophosphorylase